MNPGDPAIEGRVLCAACGTERIEQAYLPDPRMAYVAVPTDRGLCFINPVQHAMTCAGCGEITNGRFEEAK